MGFRGNPARLGVCALTQNGFVRIISQPKYPSPVSPFEAVERLRRATGAVGAGKGLSRRGMEVASGGAARVQRLRQNAAVSATDAKRPLGL